jgi:hypothetical protein
MARSDEEAWIQIAPRIPKSLHRDLRVHCVSQDVSVMGFVTAAIREKLAAPSALGAKPAKPYRRSRR